jgi:putative oxidoreductase
MDSILQTDASYANVILRAGLAVTFFAHSMQQVFGWYGGRGYKDTINNWNQKYKIPVLICVIGIFTEMAGVLAMTFGFLVRPAALGLAIFMAVAIERAHLRIGFFMNQGPGKGAGMEFCLALFLMSIALLIAGAGAWSLDGLLSR